MRKISRNLVVGSLAFVFVLTSGGSASAVTGKGKEYKKCTNYVKVWRSGGKVHAYAKTKCKVGLPVVRAIVGLTANGGKDGFVDKGKACKVTNVCTTAKVSLKAKKGWVYRGLNNATVLFDEVTPKKAYARATYKF